MKARPTPVVPVAIEGLWGSVFSRARDKRPRRLRPRIALFAGPAIAPTAVVADQLRDAVLRLRPMSI